MTVAKVLVSICEWTEKQVLYCMIKIVKMSPVSLYLLFWISAFWTVDCSVIKM